MGIRLTKVATDLSDAARAEISKRNFALTGKQSNTGKPAYPIHDREHARAALGMVGMHGTPEQKAEVHKDVARKYPDMIKKVAIALPAGPAANPGLFGRLRGAISNPHVQDHLTEIGGLGVLAVPGVDHLQAQARASLAGDDSPDAVEHRQLMGEGTHAALDVGGLGILAAPEVKKLMAMKHAMVDELLKIGAVSNEQAARAADRLDTLERQAITPGQAARNATFGAATGAGLGVLSNVVRGAKNPASLRGAAADALKGGVAGGLLPLAQRAMDRHSEESTLRDYLNNGVNNEGREFTNSVDKMAAEKKPKKEETHNVRNFAIGTAGSMAAGKGMQLAGGAAVRNAKLEGAMAGADDLYGKVHGASPVEIHEQVSQHGPHFNPAGPFQQATMPGAPSKNPHVVVTPDMKSPSILAHELGHADIHGNRVGRILQSAPTMIAGNLGPNLGGLGGFATGAFSDNETAQNAALAAPLAASVPLLGFEAGASLLGLRRLSQAGANRQQLMAAAKTLAPAFGTYAGRAAAGTAGAFAGQALGRGARNMALGGTPESRRAEALAAQDKEASEKDSGFMDAMKGALTSPIPGTGKMPIIGGIGQNVATATRAAAPAAAKGSGSFSDFQKAYRSTPSFQPQMPGPRGMGAPPPMRGAQSDAVSSSRSGPRALPLATPRFSA